MRIIFDVVISGAGPAGSKCAEVLASQGFDVALIDRDTSWRKPCGGAVGASVFKYFPKLRKMNHSPITGISIYSGDYHNIKYSWKDVRNYSINVDRLEFDNFIRDIAIDAGATLFDNNLSIKFKIKDKKKVGIVTKTSSGEKEYLGKILIIADGMSSKLARQTGLMQKWKIEELGLAKCAILEGKNDLDKELISIFFRPYKGYGWIFPLDEKRVNIGCGTFAEANLQYNLYDIYEEFLNAPEIKKFLPEPHYKSIWMGSFPVPGVGVKEKSLFKDNIMIIGDAAGFVSPISGEGIHPSIVSGQVAGETAIMALESENFTAKAFRAYKSHIKVKKIIRNFKLKRSMVEFFYENNGRNLSKMFELAENDNSFREKVINMFLFNQAPSKEFIAQIRSQE